VSQQIVHVSDSSFEQDVLKSNVPVLLDFWAEWCGPCKMIAPMLDQIAAEYAGKVLVAKMNVDENPKTPMKFSVRGIPTLILFKTVSCKARRSARSARATSWLFWTATCERLPGQPEPQPPGRRRQQARSWWWPRR